ncbi:MAG TPA: GEVED domain-containing protein [Chitinophagales bacterium]|nr:GEVED domain-containing protein [Chitinophagales bacterium]
MRKILLLLVTIFIGTTSAWSQRSCGTMDHLQMQLQQDPSLAQRMQEIETFTQNWIANHPSGERTVITVPVVVHVVYNTTPQNISDAQVQAQINQLNADYARTNSDAGNTPSVWTSTAANCEVQFCLAQRDPSGNATNGIVHKFTSTTSFSSNDGVKHNGNGGDDAWPAGSYLNLWSCNLGGGLLGYAQFPGGPASTDGVVVLYSSVGSLAQPGTLSPYNYGRTATHEVGHWLNLIHIWGDANCGNDQVGDTPTQQTSNFGCPSFPHVTCSNGPNGDMFMNYMDYTDDGCMNMFTAGQKTRMQALFTSGGSRFSIVSSQGCVPPSGGSCGIPSGLSATSVTTSSATLNWGSVSGATSYNVQYRVVGNATWTSTTSTTTSKAISSLVQNTQYEFQVQAVCTSGSSAFSGSANFTTLSSGGGTYCASNGNSQAYEYIDYVSLGTISRTSGPDAGGYYNGTASSTNVSQGSGYTITFSAGFTGSTYSEHWAIFCDWNSDGDFLDANETAASFTSSGSGNNSATISVPSTATVASTRMRVSMKYGAAPSSCESFAEGEVEDYSLNVQAGNGGGCANTPEPNNTSSTASAVQVGTDLLSQIGTSTDVDWYSFANTTTNHNIKVTLGTLPGDYDIKLYNPTGGNVATSQLGGTSSETIIYNTSTIGTYKIKVYGYGGAFSSTQCYTMHVFTSANPFRFENGSADGSINTDKSDITIFPNPAFDNMTVQFNSDVKDDAVLNVYNLLGQRMYSTTFLAFEGQNTFNMNVGTFDKGAYIVVVTNGNEVLRKEFVVTK